MIKVNLQSEQPVQITCKRGDTFVFDGLDFYADTAKTIPIDISADTFAMQVKDADDVLILDFVSPTNFTVSGTYSNHLAITMDAASMLVDASPIGQPYKYDLQWTTAGGDVTTLMYGQFVITQDITNA